MVLIEEVPRPKNFGFVLQFEGSFMMVLRGEEFDFEI